MKYKVIKSVAHNFGHSFVSLMNYVADDYVMSYVVRAALSSRARELRVDLLSGEASPGALLPDPVKQSVTSYVGWFPKLLASHRIEASAVTSATLALRLNIDRVSDDIGFANHVELPYECEVVITDDRGRTHRGTVRGWWSAHRGGPPPLVNPRVRGFFRAHWRAVRSSGRPWWKFWGRAA